jgi:hypothetical protein
MAVTDPTRVRTTINVDREVYEIFVGMAASGNMSVGKCIGEWLADTAEGAQFVASKMVEARKAPMVVMREMQAMASGLQDNVADTIRGIQDRSKGSPPQRQRGGAAGGRSRGAGGGVAPSGNTGLKVPRAGGGRGAR